MLEKFGPKLKKLGITMAVISEDATKIVVELRPVQSRAFHNMGKAQKMFPASWEGKLVEVRTKE